MEYYKLKKYFIIEELKKNNMPLNCLFYVSKIMLPFAFLSFKEFIKYAWKIYAITNKAKFYD